MSHNYKKSLGQNFIYDTNFLNSILDEINLNSDSTVVEIGAGMGTLTQCLASRFKRVVSFEIDKDLVPPLTTLKQKYPNLEVIFEDILKVNILDLEKNLDNKPYFIIANLPYYITSPIIFKFLFDSTSLKQMFVMVQKEVGDRFCASVSSKDYGASSVILNTFASCKVVRVVKKQVFTPMPKVDSCIVKIDLDKSKFGCDKQYVDFVYKCFQMKRKTLINNLIKSGYDKQKIIEILDKLNLKQTTRPEELNVEHFVSLYQILHKN